MRIIGIAVAALLAFMSSLLIGAERISPQDAGIVCTAQSPNAALKAVPIRAVSMQAGFWKPRLEANRTASLPKLLSLLEENGVVDNFRRLSGRKKCDRRGPLFTDSDLFKWMEASALVLQSSDDPSVRESLDKIIDEVVAAQQKDGYLNTWFVDDRADKRWTRMGSDHELYCAGHLFQAAIAHYRATGSRKLLDPALRYADLACEVFGDEKKVKEADGHPEVEMALVELYRTTGEKKYLQLAEYFLRRWEVLKRPSLAGHAVRQMYLCCGGTDYWAESGDKAYLDKNLELWKDLVTAKMYVTGGVGPRGSGEAFGDPFELPNYSAYAETCAAIGNGMWNWRMLSVTGDARYADMLERVLYNGFLSGVSLTGTEYFYVNPMASHGNHQRVPWFGCTCCPPNVERTFASIPGYMYSTTADGLCVNLYDNSELNWRVGGKPVKVRQETRYPWDGQITVTVSPESAMSFALNLRIPGWCSGAKVSVNGEAIAKVESGKYLAIQREWKSGDQVKMDLPMPVRVMACDDRVADNRGRVALMRGPVLYCFEATDNPGAAPDRLAIAGGADGRSSLSPVHEDSLLGGVTVLRGKALRDTTPEASELYFPLNDAARAGYESVDATAIPYYAWANRGSSAMNIWIRLQR